MRTTTRKLAQPTSRALTLAYLMDFLIAKMDEAIMRLPRLKLEAISRWQIPLLRGNPVSCRAVVMRWVFCLVVVAIVGLQSAHAQGIQYSFKIPAQPGFQSPEGVVIDQNG